MMDYLLNLFYVYMMGCADWNTLPLWVRAAAAYLAMCGLLSMLFGVEWIIVKWESRKVWNDCTDEHAEKPNPL